MSRGTEVTSGPASHAKHLPRDLRHSFVSILSVSNVPLEDISQRVGHVSTSVTETVCRHEIRPALTKGATAIHKILKTKKSKPALASYLNRVLNLSPRNRNQDVQHLPGSHKQARLTFAGE
jgi:hypothetical protein